MKTTEEILDVQERSIGLAYLYRTPAGDRPDGWIYKVRIDGAMLMSSANPLSERELATQGIAAHRGGDDLKVLIGGLGLGHTAQAALESPKAGRVQVIEMMDFVIDWMRSGLLPLSQQMNSDPRVELVQADVYGQLLDEPTQTWDVILVDVDHSPNGPLDPASLPFYTLKGQTAVQRHLAPGGVLVVWSSSDDAPFAKVMASVYPEAWREHIEWDVVQEGEEDMHLHNVLFFGRLPEA
jgi:spermidine synthase